ncbi:nitroreductase family protein [Alkalicoccus chagannorensis]|uniref:nitroreductase family protein n=1 Tax=Alkalicoccus chagannorensis TaxID=427072 RepID=UPI0003FDFB82|nr:nitroreductase [Alkalicoccus chagannorensis]
MEESKQTNLERIIKERRTIRRNYKEEEVAAEDVLELLDTAVWAPNHRRREPWRFLFIPPERRETFADTMAEIVEGDDESRRLHFMKPSAYLVVIMTEGPTVKQWEENVGAVCALIQNFQLLAWERKLGVCWKTDAYLREEAVREFLDIESHEKIVGLLHLGYVDEDHIPDQGYRDDPRSRWTTF